MINLIDDNLSNQLVDSTVKLGCLRLEFVDRFILMNICFVDPFSIRKIEISTAEF